VKVGTVKVSAVATTFSNSTVEFNSVLSGGTSYVLVVDVKKCNWARSNIYWDAVAQKLTFVPAGNDLSKQGYQGVFFKYGSLVGISPAGVDYVGQAVPIYVPIPSNSTWSATTSSAKGYTTWGYGTNATTSIPYLDGVDYSGCDAMDAAQNTTTMYQGFRGDICQYLSKTGAVTGSYRLPTGNELFPTTTLDWTRSGDSSVNNSLGNAEGTVDLLNATNNKLWAKHSDMGDVVFPASGGREPNLGKLASVGGSGAYWSGLGNATTGIAMGFSNISATLSAYQTRSNAMPIRCVQN
jgi:hypothetical protein